MNETVQFGLTMLAVGMGGTILTLLFIAAIIRALTAIFPPEKKSGEEDGHRKENSR